MYIHRKWRIGVVAIRNIEEGDEVVWDYGVRGETEWGRCRLMDSVVRDAAGASGFYDEVREVMLPL